MQDYISIILIAFALSLDAFSVSITCGIKLHALKVPKYLKIAITFALFQAIMPLGGWLLGALVYDYINEYAKWISFTVSLLLSIKIFHEHFKPKDQCSPERCNCDSMSCLTTLAVATSIDAFLVGIVLSLYKVSFYISLPIIGFTTLVMSLIGCIIGHRANLFLKEKALVAAGVILAFLAIKSVF